MTAEREQFEIEARRKEALADSLSALLLWETNDEERVILVEECKEAILSLSTRKETFLGTSEDESSATNDSSNITTDHASELLRKELSSRITALGKSNGNMPPLLENFDLDAHIGLVRRMFDVDPNLVEMHGNLSGTAVDEVVFWKNYFLNCALTRSDIGLSIHEIWGNDVHRPTDDELREQAKVSQKNPLLFSFQSKTTCPSKEEEITFDEDASSSLQGGDAKSCSSTSKSTTASGPSPSLPPLLGGGTKSISSDNDVNWRVTPPNDYDVVSTTPSDSDLEDLDAEIARELEN